MDSKKEEQGTPDMHTDKQGESRVIKWDEMGIEQKLEKLRQTVRETFDVVHACFRQVESLREEIRRLDRHSHSPSGEVFVPLEQVRYGLETRNISGRQYDPLA